MRKIRFLSILLVVLMLAMPILASCNKGDGGSTSSSSEESSKSKTTKPTNTGSTAGMKDGYNVYADFNDDGIGGYNANTYFKGIYNGNGEDFISYDVVKEAATTADQGVSIPKALYISRKNAPDATNSDMMFDMYPRAAFLEDIYAVSFSLKITAGTKVDITVSGRKTVSNKATLNEFLKYSVSTGFLTASGRNVCQMTKDHWYDIVLMVNDADRTYDVYVDGYKLLSDVGYANAGYPNNSNVNGLGYRFASPKGTLNSEFYLDNICAYIPEDPNTPAPKGWDPEKDESVRYETLDLPDITLFDASTADWDDIEAILGKTAASGIEGYPDGTNAVPFNDAYRYVKVDKVTGEYSNLTNAWGEDIPDAGEGYDKYLMLDGYNGNGTDYRTGLTNASFAFDPEFMSNNKITVRTGKEVKEKLEETFAGKDEINFYDLTAYSTLKIEFFVPEDTFTHAKYYQFLLYLASGNRDGGSSYFSQAINTNDSKFSGRFYTWEINIASMGANRSASLTTIQSLELKFSGWKNSLNGVTDDGKGSGPKDNEHQIGIKSITLSGSIDVPVTDPSPEHANCTHTDPETGADLMTGSATILPTCSTYGYTAKMCTVCGKTSPIPKNADALEPPKGHVYYDENGYNPGEVIIAPTCIASGSTTAPCLTCGVEAVMEVTKPLGHDYITKIDSVEKWLRFECKVCGVVEKLDFVDDAPKYGEFVSALANAGISLWWGADFDNDANFKITGASDNTYNATDNKGGKEIKSGNGLSVYVRNTELKVLDNEGKDNVGKYIRLYDNTAGSHNYFNVFATSGGQLAKDFVFEYTYRLGAIGSDGKYAEYHTQLIDRTSEVTGSNYFYGVAKHEGDGTVTFVNTDFVAQMSPDNFNTISLVFHLSDNAYDIYINGLLERKNVVLNSNTAQDMTLFVCDEVRFGGGQVGTGTATDIASAYAYSANFPIAIQGVNAKDGMEYCGPIVDADFEKDGENDFDLAGAGINTNGIASIVDGKLVIQNTTVDGTEFVNISVGADKKNSNYVFSFDFNGDAENWLVNSVLFRMYQTNDYRQQLEEDVLTVDANGDILFYGQIVGNTTEDSKIDIAVDQNKNTIDIYVYDAEGTLVVSASADFLNEDFNIAEDNCVLSGFGFGSKNGVGKYAIDNLKLATGFYAA